MSTSAASGQILVVDDDDVLLTAVSSHLEQSGFRVQTVKSGRQALDLVSTHAYDLVLLEMRLPDLSGTEILRELRRRFTQAELPIIVNSTFDKTTDVLTALHLGANDYVTKDVDLDILLARIQTNVVLKRTTEELLATNDSLSRMQRKLEFDLQAAANIQQNQMPPDDLHIDGWDVAWKSVPCDTLGGDSLNIIRLDEDNWAFYVLDVSGHGVPASLLAVSVNRILTPARDGSGRHDTLLPPRPLGDGRGDQESPSVASAVYVLERLQEKFVPEEDSVQYFTIVYATLNARTGEMRIASGGHPGPILMRQGQPPQLFNESDGPAIGLIPIDMDIQFHEAQLQLHAGDTLLLYSDGVIEAFNPQQQLYGAARVQQGLNGSDQGPLRQVVSRIHEQVQDWRNGGPQQDDETLLAIRRVE